MKIKKYMNSILTGTLLLVLFAGILLTSCNDDDEKSSQIELLSFGPSGVKHGDKIKFIGHNLDKVTAIVLPGIEVPKSGFASQSAALIELIVPTEAEAGKVILKTPQGDIESKTILSFEVPVTISSITAEAKPGTNISIKGSYVNWIERITFNEGVVVEYDDFVSASVNEIVVMVPFEAQTGVLLFETGGTEPTSFYSDGELIVSLPVVTAIDPASIKHTENLTINGTNLDLITSIVFSGNKTVTTFQKAESQIIVQVPVGATKGKITLHQASPITVLTPELTIILPVVTSLTPKPSTPGQDITLTGTNLDLVQKIGFPGVSTAVTTFVSQTATKIVVTVPEGAVNGGLLFTTIHGYETPGPSFLVPTDDPSPLVMTLFDDGFKEGFGDWSWSLNSSQPLNEEQFKSGASAWKADFQAWGGCQLGQNPQGAAVAGDLTTFSFSVYGGPGTNGALLQIVLNDAWSNTIQKNVKEGEWVEFDIPISSFPNANVYGGIHRVAFQLGVSGVIWIDKVGFK
jgi:hypothetical protein